MALIKQGASELLNPGGVNTIQGRMTDQGGFKPEFGDYDPPPLMAGQEVWFYPDSVERNPIAAECKSVQMIPVEGADGKITGQKQGRTAEIVVRTPQGLQTFEAALHIRDPRCRDARRKDEGAWDYKPEPTYISEQRRRINALEERIAVLEAVLTEPAKKKPSSN